MSASYIIEILDKARKRGEKEMSLVDLHGLFDVRMHAIALRSEINQALSQLKWVNVVREDSEVKLVFLDEGQELSEPASITEEEQDRAYKAYNKIMKEVVKKYMNKKRRKKKKS